MIDAPSGALVFFGSEVVRMRKDRRPLSCVVIGAGVVGASVAARLAASGARVTLLDQDQPGRATSRWSLPG